MVKQATFSKGGPLWNAVKSKFDEFAGKSKGSPVKLGMAYTVLGVGEQGENIKVIGRTRMSLELDISLNDPLYAAAIEFAAGDGGQKNLGRVVIQISVFNPEADPSVPVPKKKKKEFLVPGARA